MILPKYVPGPYTSTSTSPTSTNATAVPSLLSFCIRALLKYPDQLGSIHQRRLAYKHSPTSRAALQSLIPHFNPDTPDDLDLSLVDPRLWACLVQIFRDLPPCFHRYSAPLSDEYMPIIQKVQQSEVTLLTVLDLQRCRELSDESVVNLKALHSLCCLDASDSSLTSYGIKTLSATLVRNGGIRRGPWGLRILRLRGCSAMDNNIFGYLKKFRLLSILDIRGTRCTKTTQMRPFGSCAVKEFFHPASIDAAWDALQDMFPDDLLPSPNNFHIHIDSLHHRERPLHNAHNNRRRATLGGMEPVAISRNSFYGSLPSSRRISMPSTLAWDEDLTLFRHPPPWSELEAVKLPEQQPQFNHKPTSVASLDKAKFDQKSSHLLATGFSSRPHKKPKLSLPVSAFLTHTVTPTSRNPFIRPSEFEKDASASRRPAASSTCTSKPTHPAPNPQGGPQHSPRTHKPLKPISTLTVPELPEHLRRKPKKVSVQKTLHAFDKSSHEAAPRKSAGTSETSRCTKPLPKRSTNKAKAAEGQKSSYDWKRWSVG